MFVIHFSGEKHIVHSDQLINFASYVWLGTVLSSLCGLPYNAELASLCDFDVQKLEMKRISAAREIRVFPYI